ncbi:hypothetical protein CPter91_1966 [Collimonas pratensis]|uniref:Uncharacterized protein n=1 Tax=Collimonas pratensis TaxID=279113 RepID=A0A127Q2N2_9BURK|nr:hypothetical protein CPter91_1966 [Collimonas pratensis]
MLPWRPFRIGKYQGLGSAGVLITEDFNASASPFSTGRTAADARNCPASMGPDIGSIETAVAWRRSNREFLNIEAAPVNTR